MGSRLLALRYRIISLMLFAFLVACAKPYPPLPIRSEIPSDYSYLIGPGDGLLIFVFGNPDITTSVTVRPDGFMTAPLVEEIPASGKTPPQLAREVEKVLATYIKNPLVTVIVTSFSGPFSEQVRVVGQATNPTALPYRESMTLLDLMIQVGGLSEFAAGNSATVIRYIDGEPQQFGVRIADLLQIGDLSANVDMLPGDILVIPEAFF